MSDRNECRFIRTEIEKIVIHPDFQNRDYIDRHINICSDCKEYLADIEKIHSIAGLRFSIPEYERIAFSAKVRTRIEEKKRQRKKPAIIAHPAFQIFVMLIVIISVLFYLTNTEPQTILVHEDDLLEYYDLYAFYYFDYGLPDESIIDELYIEALDGIEYYESDMWYQDYLDVYFYYYDEEFSPEEINYIIQRLGDV